MSEEDLDELIHWLEEEGVPNIPIPINDRRTSYLSKDKWVVIQSGMTEQEQMRSRGGHGRSHSGDRYLMSSKITSRFMLEDEYRLLPMTSIASPAYCIPLNLIDRAGDHSDYLHVSAKHMWSSAFLPEV